MFNKKYKERIVELEKELQDVKQKSRYNLSLFTARDLAQKRENDSLRYKLANTSMSDLMRESLGMQIDFSAADTKACLPPFYLDNLEDAERKNFIAEMETIHKSEKFQQVVRYMINLFALNMVFKEEEKAKLRNQGAVVAFRTFLKQFEDMHREFISYKKVDEEFDELSIMPE